MRSMGGRPGGGGPTGKRRAGGEAARPRFIKGTLNGYNIEAGRFFVGKTAGAVQPREGVSGR